MMDGAVIETAICAGYRHFDVSGFHGNQADIGVAVQKLFQEGVVKREELFFTEKLGFVAGIVGIVLLQYRLFSWDMLSVYSLPGQYN